MLKDYGTQKVSLIKYQDFYKASSISRYNTLSNKLIVCTYDPINLDFSGTFNLYTVSDLNSPLEDYQSFSGMGKIVSLTYRER